MDVLVRRVVEVCCSPVEKGDGVSGPEGGVEDGGVGVGVSAVDEGEAGTIVDGIVAPDDDDEDDNDEDAEGEFVPPGTGPAPEPPGLTPPPPLGQVDGAQLSAWIVIS